MVGHKINFITFKRKEKVQSMFSYHDEMKLEIKHKGKDVIKRWGEMETIMQTGETVDTKCMRLPLA